MAAKRDTAVSQNRRCLVCGKSLTGKQRKTCSDRCRKLRSNRRQEFEHKAYETRESIRQLEQSYEIGAFDDDYAVAVIDYLQKELDHFRLKQRVKFAKAATKFS